MEGNLHRFSATKMLLNRVGDAHVVANLGPSTDELWHAGHRDLNFYTYGSMGLCSSIALGMALSTEERVVSLDGDGSLLDHMTILYGSGISNSTRHSGVDLPLMLVGGGAGRLPSGRHLRFTDEPSMANLLVTLMDKMGVPVEKVGGSSGALPIDTLHGLL